MSHKSAKGDELQALVDKYLPPPPKGATVAEQKDLTRRRKVLLIELNSIEPFVKQHKAGISPEKARKRIAEKVRANAKRLFGALKKLDDDGLEFAGCQMLGANPQDRKEQVNGFVSMQHLKQNLSRLKGLQPTHLPPLSMKCRPELLIAVDVLKALQHAKIKFAAADTGVAADCFREVARRTRITSVDSPRYWIGEAKKHPEL